MPKNLRPSKAFDSFRANQSWAEIEDAQNTWDLLETQEEANRLKKQELEMKKQEIENQIKQKQIDRNNQEIKALQEEIEAKQRAVWNKVVKDFSKIGMEAGDVSSFTSLIVQGPKYKREEEIKAMLKDLKGEHRLLKLNEDNYDYEKHVNKIRDYEIQLKNCKRGLFASREDKQKYVKLKKKLDDLKFEFDVIQEDFPNTPENRNKLKEVKARIPENEVETKNLEKELKEVQEYNNTKKEEIRQAFNEFRRNHYNKEVEFVFKDNGFGIDFIKPSEAIGEGTIEDYKQYMRETLINVKLEE